MHYRDSDRDSDTDRAVVAAEAAGIPLLGYHCWDTIARIPLHSEASSKEEWTTMSTSGFFKTSWSFFGYWILKLTFFTECTVGHYYNLQVRTTEQWMTC